MTEFYTLLDSFHFESLASKSTAELEEILEKLYAYCLAKYGVVAENFFTESWSPNTKIKRGTTEGLDLHHRFEYDPSNSEVCSLSDKETAKMWFEQGYTHYQLAENLIPMNWIEHQAAHAIIDTLRTRQYGKYRPGCIELRRAGILNRFYNSGEAYLDSIRDNEAFTAKEYFIKALKVVADEFDAYEMIMDAWAEANGITDWYIFGYTQNSIENCFEILD